MTEAVSRYPILIRGSYAEIELPAPDVEVLPGVRCGRPEEFLSPAYWAYQARADEVDWDDHHGLAATRSLWEQVAFCLLGGHGITYEVNLAAFRHLLGSGVFDQAVATPRAIEALLAEPLDVAGRRVRYRFPRVKAGYLADAHRRVTSGDTPASARALRDWLLELKGIGPKTASWIVRNHLGSDDVAILDIHVLRAGRLAGLFTESDNVQRHYFAMEDRFLRFARGLGVRASQLDIVMWQQMRRSPTAVMAACDSQGIAFNS
jgi:N-glycosylase/DNA lyase